MDIKQLIHTLQHTHQLQPEQMQTFSQPLSATLSSVQNWLRLHSKLLRLFSAIKSIFAG